MGAEEGKRAMRKSETRHPREKFLAHVIRPAKWPTVV